MIPLEDARLQADVFKQAADASPVVQIAAIMARRSKEFTQAVRDYEDATEYGDEPAIIPVGSVEPGMRIFCGEPGDVIRINVYAGVPAVQVKYPDSLHYENYAAASSPIVVLR